MSNIQNVLKNKRGNSALDTVIMVFCIMLVLALAMKIFPAYIAKQKIDTFATEVMRVAEIAGEIGSATSDEESRLRSELGIDPTVSWSTNGRVQLNGEMMVNVAMTVDIGLFANFGSFPINLRADASGKSEVYWR